MASHLVCLHSIPSIIHVIDPRVTGEHIWYRTGPSQLFFLLQGTYPRIFRICDIECFHQIGACRHGDRCSRKHIKPPFSQTILLPNVYHNPAHDPVCKLTEKELQEGFDAVYEDLYCELAKFGHLLELHVSLLCYV
jgi:hypothetical protein